MRTRHERRHVAAARATMTDRVVAHHHQRRARHRKTTTVAGLLARASHAARRCTSPRTSSTASRRIRSRLRVPRPTRQNTTIITAMTACGDDLPPRAVTTSSSMGSSVRGSSRWSWPRSPSHVPRRHYAVLRAPLAVAPRARTATCRSKRRGAWSRRCHGELADLGRYAHQPVDRRTALPRRSPPSSPAGETREISSYDEPNSRVPPIGVTRTPPSTARRSRAGRRTDTGRGRTGSGCR